MNCLEAINSDIIDKTFDNYIVDSTYHKTSCSSAGVEDVLRKGYILPQSSS